jgi:hypothetical protein
MCSLGVCALFVPRAAAQLNEIVGDLLTVQATAGSRSATANIANGSLVPVPGTGGWGAITPAGGINIFSADNVFLGSFSGSVAYDPGFDNIFMNLTFIAGAADTRFTVRSADLTNSFGGGDFQVSGALADQNGDGATMTGFFSSRLARVEWNGVAAANLLPGFSVPAGGHSLHQDGFMDFGGHFGTLAVREDFTLTANDSIATTVNQITSIPAPGAQALGAVAIFLACRHRRR